MAAQQRRRDCPAQNPAEDTIILESKGERDAGQAGNDRRGAPQIGAEKATQNQPEQTARRPRRGSAPAHPVEKRGAAHERGQRVERSSPHYSPALFRNTSGR